MGLFRRRHTGGPPPASFGPDGRFAGSLPDLHRAARSGDLEAMTNLGTTPPRSTGPAASRTARPSCVPGRRRSARRQATGSYRPDRHRAYRSGRHTAQGRYPAASASASSAKNTR